MPDSTRLDAHLDRQANATMEATNKLLEVGAYAEAAALLRSMGLQESLVYRTARTAAVERGEEDELMDMLYGDLFPDPA